MRSKPAKNGIGLVDIVEHMVHEQQSNCPSFTAWVSGHQDVDHSSSVYEEAVSSPNAVTKLHHAPQMLPALHAPHQSGSMMQSCDDSMITMCNHSRHSTA